MRKWTSHSSSYPCPVLFLEGFKHDTLRLLRYSLPDLEGKILLFCDSIRSRQEIEKFFTIKFKGRCPTAHVREALHALVRRHLMFHHAMVATDSQ